MTRPYRSNVPYARKALTQLAKDLRYHDGPTREHAADRIDKIVKEHLWSNTPDHRAPRKAVTTKKKLDEALKLKGDFPTASYLEIGANTGLNPGRVSEAYHARKKREEGV
jgi:hypothetical protein